MTNVNKYSAKALMDFLTWMSEKGLLNKSTSESRRSAAVKIIDVLDEAEKSDLRKIDGEELFKRFINLRGQNYTPSSHGSYKSRFLAALNDFIRYVDNPVGFRPATALRGTKTGKVRAAGEEGAPVQRARLRLKSRASHEGLPSPSNLSVPIPLRKDLVVRILDLPPDLTSEEAKKISTVVNAFVSAGK